MGQSVTETVWIEDLQAGAVCTQPVYDESGVLLLGANTTLSQSVIDGLTDRGIESIQVDPRDVAALKGVVTTSVLRQRKASKKRAETTDTKWRSGQPLKERLVDRFNEPLSPSHGKALEAGMLAAKKQIDEIQSSIREQGLPNAELIGEVAELFADFLVEDHDQTVGSLGSPAINRDLADRSIKLASLGMAVGVELGLDGNAVCDIGTAGLLHDIGLYSMDKRFATVGIKWTDDEFWEYQKHPILSKQMLDDVGDIPNQVRIAVEQVHEQYDGSGFPRGMKGQRIHTYARILNVVDSYLQLILPNNSRPGIVPHDALGILLHQARHGMFEPAVIRAFLLTESLFPLGSHVELTNGATAKVIRRPRDGYSAPVIEVEGGERIDLATSSEKIVRPATDSECEQIRVSHDDMQVMQWTPTSEYVSS